MIKKVLIADDDATFSLMLKSFLAKHNFTVKTVGNVDKALELLGTENFDIILSDYKMQGKDGLDFLFEIIKAKIDIPFILMTSYGEIRLAVRAIKSGAYDYLTKPINPSELLELLNNIKPKEEEDLSQNTTKTDDSNDFIHGNSDFWQTLNEEIEQVAPTNFSVIINGESGTGKEFIARKIHHLSNRSEKPFIAIDCGTLSKEMAGSELFGHVKGAFTGAISDKIGQFEFANGGTIFLDEIGNLSYDIQIQLLRAIQERAIRKIGDNKDKKIDVRIIVATNDDLSNSITENLFREDLYHRLNEFKIELKPLRERKEDISIFAEHYLKQSNVELNKKIIGFSKEAIKLFQNYPWTGNLRELKNCVRRAALMTKGNYIEIENLPSEIKNNQIEKVDFMENTVDLKELSQNIEKVKIIEALQITKYNKSKAAQLLNIDRKTLYNKIKEYNL